MPYTHSIRIPQFSPRPCLMFGFLADLSWNMRPNLSGTFSLNLSPVPCISLSGLMADVPEQSQLKPRVCPPLRTQCTPMTTNTHCGAHHHIGLRGCGSQFRPSRSFQLLPLLLQHGLMNGHSTWGTGHVPISSLSSSPTQPFSPLAPYIYHDTSSRC